MKSLSRVFLRIASLTLLAVLLLSCQYEIKSVDGFHSISVNVSPAEAEGLVFVNGSASGSGDFPSGSRVTVEARPPQGWVFDHWDGAVAGSGNPLEVVLHRDTELTAVFKPRWNFLVYLAADNDLEDAAYGSERSPGDFGEMEQIGSSDQLEILVLADRAGSSGTNLYRILKDTGSPDFSSEVLAAFPELAMDDPRTLSDFLVYAAEHFPAEHTVLTLWDHGTGVYPRGIGYDFTSLSENPDLSPFYCLTTDEVAAALGDAREKTGVRPDIIQTDACLMQMLEIAWEWSGEADFLVGSEADVPIPGNDYMRLLGLLSKRSDISPREYAEQMVDIYSDSYVFFYSPGVTFSAIDLGRPFEELREAFSAFSSMLPELAASQREPLLSALSATTAFGSNGYYDEFVDLRDFLLEARPVLEENGAGEATERLLTAMDAAVLLHRANGSYGPYGSLRSFGLSILFPRSRTGLRNSPSFGWEVYRQNGYGQLSLARDSSWDEFLDTLFPDG